MKTLQERLIYAREQKQMSQAALGKAIGKTQSTIAALETGRNKGTTHIAKLAEILNVSAIWLETGEGEMRPRPRDHEISDIHAPRLWSRNAPLSEDEYTFAPHLKETEFTGGSGSFEIPDYNGFRLPFGKSTLYRKGIRPDKVFCCTLNGDSMEPRIDEGAAIGVDTGDTVIKDGKIYAFRHDDLFRVKYLHRIPGGRVIIRSQNGAYGDEEAGLEDIVVIGRVFWWGVLD